MAQAVNGTVITKLTAYTAQSAKKIVNGTVIYGILKY